MSDLLEIHKSRVQYRRDARANEEADVRELEFIADSIEGLRQDLKALIDLLPALIKQK